MDCYRIRDYERRYLPRTKKGEPFKNEPPYILVPNKPQGRGLRKLSRLAPDGLRAKAYFGIFVHLLEVTTANAPHLRGYLVNNDDEPATIEEIATELHLSDDVDLVAEALTFLTVDMRWLEVVPSTELRGVFSNRHPTLVTPTSDLPPTQVAPTSTLGPTNETKRNETKPTEIKKTKTEKAGATDTKQGGNGALDEETAKLLWDGMLQTWRTHAKIAFTDRDRHTFDALFVEHFGQAGKNRKSWDNRVLELGALTKQSVGKDNPAAYFVAAQKAKYLQIQQLEGL